MAEIGNVPVFYVGRSKILRQMAKGKPDIEISSHRLRLDVQYFLISVTEERCA